MNRLNLAFGFSFVGCLLAGTIGCSSSSSTPPPPPPPDPTVEGPITEPGAPFVAGTRGIILETVGYEQAEYFVSGTAASYTSAEELSSDGRWEVEEGETADYKTRALVYRPHDPRAFSGTVVVEWLNVSGGLDAAPDWSAMHTEIMREGHVWVGVSAQIVGIEGSPGSLTGFYLKAIDPVRYGPLLHPGDSFSYSMYAQVAQALRSPVGVDPLDGLVAERVIAVGESQSAGRLVTYVNALARQFDVFDAYLIHSRGSGSPPLAQSPQAAVPTPEIVHVREDLDEPVLMFQTETDLVILGSLPDNQPDSRLFRLWEVAGTAHNDVYSLVTSNSDLGDDPSVADVVEISNPVPGIIDCPSPINSGPQHWVLKAGLHGLIEWVVDGTPLPEADRLSANDEGDGFQLDQLGNVLGGIRTNYVDVPVAVLSGLGQTGGSFCRIFGTTNLFDDTQLGDLYPTEQGYVDAVTGTTEAAVAAGFVLQVDANLIIAAAEDSDIGGGAP